MPSRSRPSARILAALAALAGLIASVTMSGAARAADPGLADLLEVLRKRDPISRFPQIVRFATTRCF